jgi:hypothetical protein
VKFIIIVILSPKCITWMLLYPDRAVSDLFMNYLTTEK